MNKKNDESTNKVTLKDTEIKAKKMAFRDFNETHNHYGNNEILKIFPMELESIINSLYENQKREKREIILENNFDYIDLPQKNIINKLSPDYFEIIIRDADKHATDINEVLKFEEIQEKYMAVAYDINTHILAVKGSKQLNSFDECLEYLKTHFISNMIVLQSDSKKKKIMYIVIYHMYLSCDIGKKTNKEIG